MFSPKYTIELSEHANQDIADIIRYTAKTWGQPQQEEYEATLEKGFQMIAENPNIGRYKQAYKAYFLNIGSHVVIYIINGQTVYIIRVLHSKMEIDGRL